MQATMDDITAPKPEPADANSPVKGLVETPPEAAKAPNDPAIEPLDVLESPPIRTKLRIYSILTSLYVHHHPIKALVFSLLITNKPSSWSSSSQR